MPKSYKLKLVLGGAKGSGKTSFINGNVENDTPIGVSFIPIECYANDSDSYKFVIWDLKDRARFKFLFPLFCRGACAGLLCFDQSNRDSFVQLKDWIRLFRKSAGNIPIILIGTKSDLPKVVTDEEIKNFIHRYRIEDIFYSSIYDETEVKTEIFKTIVEKLEPNYPIKNFSLFTPEYLDTKEFKTFIKLFSTCPICKKENHYESLKNFYLSKDPNDLRLKEQLMGLIESFHLLNKSKLKHISIGIPCCNCYKSIFEKNYC